LRVKRAGAYTAEVSGSNPLSSTRKSVGTVPGGELERYLSALETADRQEGELAEAKSARLKDKIASLREQMRKYKAPEPMVQHQ
jgi:PEP-CTERM motif